MTPQQVKAYAIAKVAEDYRRRSYDVDVEPTGPSLPAFLEGFQPDLIARSPDDSVVVEVKVGTQSSVADRFRDVAERINRQPGWRFSVVYVSQDEPGRISDSPPAPRSTLEERLRKAEALLQTGQSEAAFLLLWSALEGVLRLLSHQAQLPLENLPSPALIRELYSAGELDVQQFETLMRLLPTRNRLFHGLESQEETDVEGLRDLVRALLAELTSA